MRKYKKMIFAMIAAFLLVFALAACGSSQEDEAESTEAASAGTTDGNGLVVYFSWSGNTESVAQEIQSQTGADIFRIEPAEAYTDDYDELLDVAQEEQSSDARPEIADTIDNFDDYEVIYLGYPNWWGDMPQIIYSFLDDYDLSGKTLIPFCTSGGSGFSGSLDTIADMEPDAVMLEGLHIGGSSADDAAGDVTQWLQEIGIAQ
ncbi:MAG: flavodoxin [Bacillota bacterium]|nr:flavodoxin [Bacillota bacterium]